MGMSLAMGLSLTANRGGGAAPIPASAIRDRAGNVINDRAGSPINVRT
jgi:hypothetical protein